LTNQAPAKLEEEYAEPLGAWRRQPSPATAGALLKAVRPVIDTAVTTYAPGSSPAVAGRAKLMALAAMQRYDPRQMRLRSFLLSQLQSLRRVGREGAEPIRWPERIVLDLHNIERSRRELEDRLGRDPTTSELSDYSGLSPLRISRIRQAKPALSEGSLERRRSELGSGGAMPPVANPDDDAWTEFVYHDLAPNEQKIFEWTTGYRGAERLSSQAIADKFGLSPAAISHRRADIQAKFNARPNFL